MKDYEFENDRKRAYNLLDQMDILPILTKAILLDDLIEKLQELKDEYDDGDALDALTEGEIMKYIENRFHVDFCAYYAYVLMGNPQKGTRYDPDTVSDVSEME